MTLLRCEINRLTFQIHTNLSISASQAVFQSQHSRVLPKGKQSRWEAIHLSVLFLLSSNHLLFISAKHLSLQSVYGHQWEKNIQTHISHIFFSDHLDIFDNICLFFKELTQKRKKTEVWRCLYILKWESSSLLFVSGLVHSKMNILSSFVIHLSKYKNYLFQLNYYIIISIWLFWI